MELLDAIFAIERMGDNAVICAREPFVWGSEAVIVEFTEGFGIPADVEESGYAYFLGREEVAKLLEMASRKAMSPKTIAEFVCHYALTDAYPAWFDDLTDK